MSTGETSPIDVPSSQRLLLHVEEERMREHVEAMFRRLEKYLRKRFEDVCMSDEECAVTGPMGREEVAIRCAISYRDNNSTVEAYADIQVGSISQDGDDGYFSAITPDDAAMEDCLLLDEGKR